MERTRHFKEFSDLLNQSLWVDLRTLILILYIVDFKSFHIPSSSTFFISINKSTSFEQETGSFSLEVSICLGILTPFILIFCFIWTFNFVFKNLLSVLNSALYIKLNKHPVDRIDKWWSRLCTLEWIQITSNTFQGRMY